MKAFNIFLAAIFLIISGNSFAAPSVSVTFVMDESGSVTSPNFKLEKDGFIKALDNLPQNGSVELSSVDFASSSRTLISPIILDTSTFNSIKTTLENNTQSGGGTNMSSAINRAAGLLSSSSAPTKIICLATDGRPWSQSSTRIAATNAKNAGITLSPVGIGLNSSGKTFLDSIASNPPIPNPSNFTEFATVVTNDCVGAVKSALNIQLTPDPVDFGSFNASTIDEDLKICAKEPEVIDVLNQSNQPAKVTKIELTGSDASDFELVSFMGVDIAKLAYPIIMSPKIKTQIRVRLKPNKIPADKTYDANVALTAEDSNSVSGVFSTTLIAKIDPSFPSCLGLSVIDAFPLINSISDQGIPLKADQNNVGEIDIALALQNDKKQELVRRGIVADGNARLLLVSRTRKNTGKVRLEIVNPSSTKARLYSLDFSPTYIAGTRDYDETGKIKIDLDIATDPDGNGQITAILRAGESYSGAINTQQTSFKIKACILDANDNCEESKDETKLSEGKAPVVLIHGVWSDNNTWFDDNDRTKGMHPSLAVKGFNIAMISYDGNEGPSVTVPALRTEIGTTFTNLCEEVRENENLACSRVDIVAHSMGGLFSRRLIQLNYHNDKTLKTYAMSFGKGSVRRLVTMATPHFGSPLANVLWADTLFERLTDTQKKDTSKIPALVTNNSFINDCIIHPEVKDFDSDGGYDEIHDLVENLAGKPKKFVRSGVSDLVVGGIFQNQLNQHKFSIADMIPPLLAIAGNIGRDYDQSLVVGRHPLTQRTYRFHTIGNAEKAGCGYADVMVEDSDGIVPLNSALISDTFTNRYSGLTGYQSINSAKQTDTLSGFHHTGMGKAHPFINNDREEDDTREDTRMIDKVFQRLTEVLPK